MVVRRNKQHVESTIPISKKSKESPLHDRIIEIIRENPECSITDLYKKIPDTDQGHIRRAIRRMIEGHKIVQRFKILGV